MNKADIKGLDPNEFLEGLNTGAAIFDKAFPVIKAAFLKLAELVKEITKGGLGTAPGKRKAIEELIEQVHVLQGQNKVQKKFNGALVAKLAEHDIVIDEEGEPE